MSDEVTLTETERENHVCCVKAGRCRDDHFHARDVERILAERIAEARREGAAEAHGIRFRVETACDGYANLTESDVPDEVFDEDDYYLGAQHAAEGIRAALRGTA